MIDMQTLTRVARTKGIANLGSAEKDYFQDILLLAVSREAPGLVFKGGTALFKLHGLDRFSEDLDFTGRLTGPEVLRLARYVDDFGYPADATVREAGGGLLASYGIRGLLYQGTPRSMARVRLDASWKDEVSVTTEWRTYFPMYGDAPSFRIQAMVVEEILAEKVRALLHRRKSRDAYDVWFLLNKGIRVGESVLKRKLSLYGDKLNKGSLDRALATVSKRWRGELRPMVTNLPEFGEVSAALKKRLL